MAWFPGAIRKEVTRHRTALSANGVCNHVAVSEGSSLFNYFNQSGNPTSHLYVRKDGTVEQYVDTRYRAPANLEGNDRLISIETQGGVYNVDTEKWTSAQVESLAQIWVWCHKVHGIPLKAMANSKSTSTGIGYHRQGVDPWRVDGGEKWSNAYGKVCPGQGKINQLPAILTRAIAINGGGGTAPTPEEDDMPYTPEQLRAEVKTALAEYKAELQQMSANGVDIAFKGTNVPAAARAAAAAGVWGTWFGRDENRKTAATVLAEIAQKVGIEVDVDEAALAADLAAALLPMVANTVEKVVADLPGASANDTAAAVVDLLAQKLGV